MLSDLKEFLQYLKFKKVYPNLNREEIMKVMIYKALNEKELPPCFEDKDNINLYRVVYITCLGKNFTLTKKSLVYRRPFGWSQERVFETISFIKDFFDKKKVPTYRLINLIENVMRNEYKFTVENNLTGDEKIVDLYIYSGNLRYFIQSEFYQKYFSWYREETQDSLDLYKEESLVLKKK